MNVREIKFRIWNTTYCKMSETFTLEQFAYDQDGEMGDCQLNLNDGVGENRKENILMQFTGLHDKNGREIYEGDIVRCWKAYSHLGENGEMVEGFATAIIRNSGWSFYWEEINSDDKRGWFFYGPEGDCFSPETHNLEYEWSEVIGNIYENPEALKEGGEK